MILQNIRKHLPNDAASQPMRLELTVTTLRNISTDRKYLDWLHNYQLLKDSVDGDICEKQLRPAHVTVPTGRVSEVTVSHKEGTSSSQRSCQFNFVHIMNKSQERYQVLHPAF